MRVITFSKQFPATHQRAGEPTHFVKKILHSQLPPGFEPATTIGWPPKYHTIRKGNRWKAGDRFSARIWTGKPYRSKQQEFAQLEIKKVWAINILNWNIFLNEGLYSAGITSLRAKELAQNDGLNLPDFWNWINNKSGHSFLGQIICWSDKIEYR